MPLKSKEWFFKQCLQEAKMYTRFSHLAWDLLEKGVGQQDSTRGHVFQPIGALQRFLEQFPAHRATIQASDPTRPFDLGTHAQMLQDWRTWLAGHHGPYGAADFGYNVDTLRGYLAPNLGGTRVGGGGGGDEFKKVLRLMPEFWGRH